jgi:hypothetical protein
VKEFWWLGLATFLALPAPAVLRPPAPGCAEAPCRVCFAVAEVVDRAGGEPISCAA